MIEFDCANLSDAERNSAYLAADALEKRAKQIKTALKPLMDERMSAKEPENAVIGNVIVASITKINGGVKDNYKVVDPVMYAKWLDDHDAELAGRKATTSVRYPKDECMEEDYINLLVEQGGGELPRGVKVVAPRATSFRVQYAPGAYEDIFDGNLTPAFAKLLLEGPKDEQ